MDKTDFITTLAGLNPASTFLNLKRYRNEAGEVSNFNLIFHISYENALKRSVAVLEGIIPDSDLGHQAKSEMLISYHKSIANIQDTPIEEVDDNYTRFFDSEGKHIKGVKMHTATGVLHLYGFVHQKLVLEPGVYPKSNRRPLTIEKDKLRKLCPSERFRQFRMVRSQVESISVQHISLLAPDAI